MYSTVPSPPMSVRLARPTVTGGNRYPILPLETMNVKNTNDSRSNSGATSGATEEQQVVRAFASGGRSCPSGRIFSGRGGICNPQQWQRRRGIGWAVSAGWQRGKTAVTVAAGHQQQRRRWQSGLGSAAAAGRCQDSTGLAATSMAGQQVGSGSNGGDVSLALFIYFDGRTDGRTDGPTDRPTDQRNDVNTDRQTDRQTDRRTDGPSDR